MQNCQISDLQYYKECLVGMVDQNAAHIGPLVAIIDLPMYPTLGWIIYIIISYSILLLL